MMNENAIANIVVDLDFLEEQFRGAGRANLGSHSAELRLVSYRAPITLALARFLLLIFLFFFFILARAMGPT